MTIQEKVLKKVEEMNEKAFNDPSLDNLAPSDEDIIKFTLQEVKKEIEKFEKDVLSECIQGAYLIPYKKDWKKLKQNLGLVLEKDRNFLGKSFNKNSHNVLEKDEGCFDAPILQGSIPSSSEKKSGNLQVTHTEIHDDKPKLRRIVKDRQGRIVDYEYERRKR